MTKLYTIQPPDLKSIKSINDLLKFYYDTIDNDNLSLFKSQQLSNIISYLYTSRKNFIIKNDATPELYLKRQIPKSVPIFEDILYDIVSNIEKNQNLKFHELELLLSTFSTRNATNTKAYKLLSSIYKQKLTKLKTSLLKSNIDDIQPGESLLNFLLRHDFTPRYSDRSKISGQCSIKDPECSITDKKYHVMFATLLKYPDKVSLRHLINRTVYRSSYTRIITANLKNSLKTNKDL